MCQTQGPESWSHGTLKSFSTQSKPSRGTLSTCVITLVLYGSFYRISHRKDKDPNLGEDFTPFLIKVKSRCDR